MEGQITSYKTQEELPEVKKSQTGYIHYLTLLKQGMAIKKAQTIAEISENKRSQMMVEAYVNAKDISKVKVGYEVKVAINGEIQKSMER